MCLAVPGKIVSITDSDPLVRQGQVAFGAVRKSVNLAFVPEAEVGDHVLVHVGFAMCRIDEEAARATLRRLEELEEPDATP